MSPTIQLLVLLLAVVAAVAVIAARLRLPDPILLMLTGVGLALIPGLPPVGLAPELVLLMVLPPVIYISAVTMSWREVRLNLGAISLLAVGCVLFTTVVIAVAAHWLLGLPWPVGFVLGAIVSPPDTMAPSSIARRMGIPRRILVILEGEGLAIELTLSVLTPFLAFWPPEHLGGSGVLATVTTGLYSGWMAPQLMGAATRLQGLLFWDFLIYVIEGLVFLITGLQARTLIDRIGGYRLSELIFSALIVSTLVILARFVWTYPAAYLLTRLGSRIRRATPVPPWQWVFAVSFTDVRGIVSLAAALGLPLAVASGGAFPHRDLILFLTFCGHSGDTGRSRPAAALGDAGAGPRQPAVSGEGLKATDCVEELGDPNRASSLRNGTAIRVRSPATEAPARLTG